MIPLPLVVLVHHERATFLSRVILGNKIPNRQLYELCIRFPLQNIKLAHSVVEAIKGPKIFGKVTFHSSKISLTF